MDPPRVSRKLSQEEEDLMDRSKKKVKRGEHVFTGESSQPNSYAVIMKPVGSLEKRKPSYEYSFLGRSGDESVFSSDEEISKDNEGEDVESDSKIEFRIEERKLGQYDCPTFILSKCEQKRIKKPWPNAVIVKLLGRKIGIKALETRLKQIWVRKGIFHIIDLNNDFFLVVFSHREDQENALTEGPWLIYDHYLAVREWNPNFHPSSASIDKVAIWVRFSGLPIEYYDANILQHMGDRIGRTVWVDKNILSQERGKYARLCVKVDLTKPLLAMFELNKRQYKIEYERLHLLCLTCGRFGHYMEGCFEKGKNNLGQG